MKPVLTRREFVRGATLAAAGSVLAACTPKTGGETPVGPTAAKVEPTQAQATAAPQSGKCQIDWTPTLPPPPKKYDPPIKISTFAMDTPRYIGNDTVTDNVMSRRLKENLGIEYTIEWQASGDLAQQKLQAAVASGTLPDTFSAGGADLAKLIDNEAVEDITAIWEATASPLTKQKKGYPNSPMWTSVKRSGKIYGVAFLWGPGYNTDSVGWIRQDWLDKLGLKMPETLDELTATVKAFKDNKLCQFGMNACKALINWDMSLDPVFGAYGAMPTCWRSAADGSLEYDSLNPAVKDGLAVLRGWYADGLLDPDFYTYAESAAEELVGAQKVGVFYAPWWILILIVPLEQQNAGMKWVTMPVPKGPAGKQGRKASGLVGDGVVFRKGLDPKKIEAVINQLNWQIEMHVNWEKYQQYGEQRNSYAFAEGYDWDWDEKCELKKGPVEESSYIYANGIGMGFPFMCYPEYQADVNKDMLKWYDQDPGTLNKAQKYLMSDPKTRREAETYQEVFATLGLQIPDEFLGAYSGEISEVVVDLQKLESEAFMAIVTGGKPLEAFDQFVNDWTAAGGDKLSAFVNDWKKTQ